MKWRVSILEMIESPQLVFGKNLLTDCFGSLFLIVVVATTFFCSYYNLALMMPANHAKRGSK